MLEENSQELLSRISHAIEGALSSSELAFTSISNGSSEKEEYADLFHSSIKKLRTLNEQIKNVSSVEVRKHKKEGL